MNTDTPETDLLWNSIRGSAFWTGNRTRILSEKLERERNQARKERDELQRLLENILREDAEGQDYKEARKYLSRMKGGSDE